MGKGKISNQLTLREKKWFIEESSSPLLKVSLQKNKNFKQRYHHIQNMIAEDQRHYLALHLDIAEKAYSEGLLSKIPQGMSDFWPYYKQEQIKKSKIFYPELYTPLVSIDYDT